MDNRLYNIKPASCCKQEQDSDCGITINLSEEPNSEYLLKSEAFCLFLKKGQYALISQLPDTTLFVKKGYADRTYLTNDALDILDLYVTIAYFDENIHDIVESEVESTTYSKNQIDTALSLKVDISSLADVATSGSYGDLQNTPTNVSQFTNDAGYLTEHQDISGKADKSEMGIEPGTGANADKTTITLKSGTSATVLTAHQDVSGKANTADLATVATTGSYNDLLNKPTIPDAQIQSDWNQSDNTKKDFIKNKPTIPDAQVQSDWNESDTSSKAYINNKPTIPDISNCIQKSSTPGLVKNDGSIDTNTYLTQHQDISGKADKASSATNGNFAALDSNGNLTDSGHKHSDYLTSHQDLTNYVQKSQTAGLLKNDGTVDTTQYLSQHQDISGKEDITPIEAVASDTTAIIAQVNKYYEVAGTVSSLTVTLPTPTANTKVTMVVVHLTVGASPTVIVTSVNEVVKFSAAYSVVANKEYELSCLYNGSKWIVSSMEVAA